MEGKIFAIMAAFLLVFCASSLKSSNIEKVNPKPTVEGFYAKVSEVEVISRRIDTTIRKLETDTVKNIARDTQYIAFADTSGRK